MQYIKFIKELRNNMGNCKLNKSDIYAYSSSNTIVNTKTSSLKKNTPQNTPNHRDSQGIIEPYQTGKINRENTKVPQLVQSQMKDRDNVIRTTSKKKVTFNEHVQYEEIIRDSSLLV
jgi:hypothetical protein